MNWKCISILSVSLGLLTNCTAAVPENLSDARAAYADASEGLAAQTAVAELRMASVALAIAEKAFLNDPTSFQTIDLAYIALRKVQLANTIASINLEKEKQVLSNDFYRITRRQITKSANMELKRNESELETSRQSEEEAEINVHQSRTESDTAVRYKQQSAARQDEENLLQAAEDKRAADAATAMATLVEVRNVPRGPAISLSGDILFASNQSTLLPQARKRLHQVSSILLNTPNQYISVEGHTDSQGSAHDNLNLSQRRADAVRAYLIEMKYDSVLIDARGLGENFPVADNGTPEGRADNRRVEIFVERASKSAGAISSEN